VRVLSGESSEYFQYLLLISSLVNFNLLDDSDNDLSVAFVSLDRSLDDVVSVSLGSVSVIVDASVESMAVQFGTGLVSVLLSLLAWGDDLVVVNLISIIRSGEDITCLDNDVITALQRTASTLAEFVGDGTW